MTPELYSRINALADAALDLPEGERLAFLEQACAGDPDLQRQVEQLLGAEAAGSGLMDAPLLEQLARDMAATPRHVDLTGRQFHHYEILSRIGAGGIAEVWLAKDVRLGRLLALKLLSPVSAADPSQTRRFEREARAASSLSHPNIITITKSGRPTGSSSLPRNSFMAKRSASALYGAQCRFRRCLM
jgi:eukaryotic-like serine/threonine-protein kinase